LTTALDGSEWSASSHGRFIYEVGAPGIHLIDWMCFGASLDLVAKKKEFHPCHCREFNSGRPAPSLVSILTELHRLPLSDAEFVNNGRKF